uniref:Dipeptidyl-peptidase n=1 Tax=Rheinheimera sp. BAL341 TaxID=1708203 RepID=A0A486XRJ8_9GAMM
MRNFFYLLLLCIPSCALALQGFWQPRQLSTDTTVLRQLGLTSAEQAKGIPLATVTPTVARLGPCSAAFISASGLLLTSPQCIKAWLEQGTIQPGADITAEIPLQGLTLALLQKTEDVTVYLHRELNSSEDLTQRAEKLRQLERQLLASCQQQADIRCELTSLHNGIEYQMLSYKILADVRLVYLPEQAAVSNTPDWPAYAASYAILRAYTATDGTAAAYAEANLPYRSDFAVLSDNGVAEDELLVTPSFIERSYRHSTAAEVRFEFEQWYPQSIEHLQQSIMVLQTLTGSDIASQPLYHRAMQNMQQNLQQQQLRLRQYQRSSLLLHRTQYEQSLTQWIDISPVRRQLYRPVLAQLQQLTVQQQQIRLRDLALTYFQYARLPALARQLYAVALLPAAEREAALPALQQQLNQFDAGFDARLDLELALHFLWQYAQLPADLRLPALDQYFALKDGFNRDVVRHKLSTIYRGTGLRDAAQRGLWLQSSAEQFKQSTDPLLNFVVAMQATSAGLQQQRQQVQLALSEARAAYMEVLLAFNDAKGAPSYAEANGTLRYSLGRVSGYQPVDAIWYQPFSSLQAYLQQQAANARVADASNIPVNFLSSSDSCSSYRGAVSFNLQGELVGVMYNGLEQSLLADWHFDAKMSRAVHVDSRFIRWQLQQSLAGRKLLAEIDTRP